jgi:lactate permease
VPYLQNYDPQHNPLLSTLLAAVPVATLLYFLAIHPIRRSDGLRHYGIPAHHAAAIAAAVGFFIAVFVFKMPKRTAGMSMVYGALYGLFPIGLIVIGAMFLYTITLVGGLFDVLKDSVAHISQDARIQAILIAFSFGAFIEGAAGFGTPVAITGALLVGLGFKPLNAAVLCLIANTAPVAFGSLGIPITALNGVTGIDPHLLGQMAGRQLPFFSLIVPVWMTAVQVRADGRPWREVWEVWPALLVAGGTFALAQFLISNYFSYMLVDTLGGAVSIGALALFCKVWKPRTIYLAGGVGSASADGLPTDAESPSAEANPTDADLRGASDRAELAFESPPVPLPYATPAQRPSVLRAWAPWALLIVIVFCWGVFRPRMDKLPGTVINWPMPFVHNVVYRTPPVVPEQAVDKAVYAINWLSAAGTSICFAAVLAGFIARLTLAQWKLAVVRTAMRLRLPLLTICLILSMGFLTKYSGMDAVLGLAFTRTGRLYPFFAAMLGWLGVALTGSDTSSNIMFGSMQQIAARQGGFSDVLITTSNSTGGVMGKMIDAQSIVVATAACYEDPKAGKLAAGPIFRKVLPHSIALAVLMGLLVMAQAYWLKWMVP